MDTLHTNSYLIKTSTKVTKTLVIHPATKNTIVLHRADDLDKILQIDLNDLSLDRRNPSFSGSSKIQYVSYGCQTIDNKKLSVIEDELNGKVITENIICKIGKAKTSADKPVFNNDAFLLDESDKYYISTSRKAYSKEEYTVIQKKRSIMYASGGWIMFENNSICKDTKENWENIKRIISIIKVIFEFIKSK